MTSKLCALRVTGTRFYVSTRGGRKYSGDPEFFEKEYLRKFVVVKIKKLGLKHIYVAKKLGVTIIITKRVAPSRRISLPMTCYSYGLFRSHFKEISNKPIAAYTHHCLAVHRSS